MNNIILDEDNMHLLQKHNWCVYQKGYAVASIDGSRVFLHHLVIGFPPKGKEVDHINRDKLDNRRENLRFVTHQENLLNRKFKNKTGFKGVYFESNRRTKPYKAMIRRNGKSINIGYYKTAAEAGAAVQTKEASLLP